MSLSFAEQILSMELPDPDHRSFGKILEVKKAVAAAMLTATARVRDGLLRPTNDDGLGALLASLDGKPAEVTAEDVFS